jgi:hypothetical protein
MVSILKLLNEAYEVSTYSGDNEYNINCTGDCVVGDEVAFERATFSGSFKSPKFDGFELVKGKIIKDSYGTDKQQHTFTLQKDDGSIFRIKGRNLYGNGTYRKRWGNEDERKVAQDEKHERGNTARAIRDQRRELENKDSKR